MKTYRLIAFKGLFASYERKRIKGIKEKEKENEGFRGF